MRRLSPPLPVCYLQPCQGLWCIVGVKVYRWIEVFRRVVSLHAELCERDPNQSRLCVLDA